MSPSFLGWTTMQHIESRTPASEKGPQTHSLIGEARSELVRWCVFVVHTGGWWVLFGLVSPTPLKLCSGEVWRMTLVSVCTHSHTGEAVWNPGRGNKGRGPVGTNHAVLPLLPTQGWKSAREASDRCWLCPTASHAGTQPLLQELLHSEQVLTRWSRAGAALSCTDMNSLVLGWWLFWGGSFGLLLSSFDWTFCAAWNLGICFH